MRPPERSCPNCGAWVSTAYCGHCGQRNTNRLVSVGRMLLDTLDDQLTLSSALPRTLSALMLRPGFLTAEYISGRIVSYIAPLRLYLVSSVLFFLVASAASQPLVNKLRGQISSIPSADSIRPDTTAVRQGKGEGRAATGMRSRNTFVNLDIDTTGAAPWFKPLAVRLQQREELLNRMDKREIYDAMLSYMQQNIPRAVFLLLPLYALLLKLLYIRRKRWYVEHFIFALHVHAFLFLLFTVTLLLRNGRFNFGNWTSPIILLYIFLAMKRVYGQGYLRTAGKFFLLGVGYFALFVAASVVFAVVSLFTVPIG